MGREIDNIHRSDAVIICGGRSGTLGEFAIAYNEARPIGVLLGSGGVADSIRQLVRVISKAGKEPGAPIVYDSDPQRLAAKLKATKAAATPTNSDGGYSGLGGSAQ